MERKEKASVVRDVSRAEPLKDALRDKAREAFPYIVGTAGAVGIAVIKAAVMHRFGNSDAIFDPFIFAAPWGVKIFKDAKRDSRKMDSLEHIQTARLKRKEQQRIAVFGTFSERSALLSNPHLFGGAWIIIKSDNSFKQELIDNLTTATGDLVEHQKLLSGPDSQYNLDMIKAIRRSIKQYESNLFVLYDDNFASRSADQAARAAKNTGEADTGKISVSA